jgi:hypothetical protein
MHVRLAVVALTLGVLVPASHAQGPCEPCDQARILRGEGKSKDAATLLKKAGKEFKDSAELHGLVVLCAIDLGKPKDAGAALPKFLGAHPTPAQLAEVRDVVGKAATGPSPRNVRVHDPDGALPAIVVLFSGAAYPRDAAEFGIERTVILDAVIAVDGTAKRIEMRTDAHWADTKELGFEEAAVSALKRWRFFPALLDGRPVESSLTVVGIFEMIE